MEQISITEAQEQLDGCSLEVDRIRAKITEVQANNSIADAARRERELADRLMDGGDIAEIIAPALTSAQVRRAVQVLESALAEALDRENQAKGALRRARIGRMRALLTQERELYDATATDLMNRWLRVSLLAQQVDAATNMSDTLPSQWYRLTLPRGIAPKTYNAYMDESCHFANATDLLSTVKSNAVRTEIKGLLEKEGVSN